MVESYDLANDYINNKLLSELERLENCGCNNCMNRYESLHDWVYRWKPRQDQLEIDVLPFADLTDYVDHHPFDDPDDFRTGY